MDNKNRLSPKENNAENRNSLGIVAYESLSPKNRFEPQKNQDRILNLHDKGIYGVFDGMGGMKSGDEFAEATKNFMATYWKDHKESDPQLLRQQMEQALLTAASSIPKQINENGGTTATMLIVTEHDEKRWAVIGSVGDSSALLFRNGELIKLVKEDSGPIDKLVKNSIISPEEAKRIAEKLDNVQTHKDFSQLSPIEQHCFRNRNQISQVIGYGSVTPHVNVVELHDGDEILLMTDGIRDNLADQEMRELLTNSLKKNKAQTLDQAALAKAEDHWGSSVRGKPDDRGIIYLSIQNKSPQQEVETSDESNPLLQLAALHEHLISDEFQLPQNIHFFPHSDRKPRNEEKESSQEQLKVKLVATDAWNKKEMLLSAPTENTWDVHEAKDPVVTPHNRIAFPDRSGLLSFDPEKLAQGIFAGDYISRDEVRIYYPHEGKSGLTKTVFSASLDETEKLLQLCAQQKGWSEDAVIKALSHITTGLTIGSTKQMEAHRNDVGYALYESFTKKQQQKEHEESKEEIIPREIEGLDKMLMTESWGGNAGKDAAGANAYFVKGDPHFPGKEFIFTNFPAEITTEDSVKKHLIFHVTRSPISYRDQIRRNIFIPKMITGVYFDEDSMSTEEQAYIRKRAIEDNVHALLPYLHNGGSIEDVAKTELLPSQDELDRLLQEYSTEKTK